MDMIFPLMGKSLILASMNVFVVSAIIGNVIRRVAFATEYIVGDDSGWTIEFDYAAWAKDKEFRVGDKLGGLNLAGFNYPVGVLNVNKVNGTGRFKDCIVPPESEALSSGNYVTTIATPGNKWIGQHCTVGGQKLSIIVLPALGEKWQAPSPAPATWALSVSFNQCSKL